jgi:hypothetical protein
MPRLKASCLLAFVACAFSPVSWAQLQTSGNSKIVQPPQNRQFELPLAFEPNRGQAASGVDYITTTQGQPWQLRADSVTINVSGTPGLLPHSGKTASQNVIQIALFNADKKATATSENKLPGYTNYLFGSNPANWITRVDRYGKVRYQNIYPGIDLVFHGNENRLEQDFVLRPGAEPQRIRFRFRGVQHAELSDDGNLVLRAGDATFQMQKPRAYQQVRNERVEVPVQYALNNGSASFRLGPYDKRLELTIDPVLVYSTFLGGTSAGSGNAVTAMAVDSSGLYLTGTTNASNFPVTSGVIEPTLKCCSGTFVTKLDPTGQSLIFSTYIQGFADAPSVAVDSSGDIYLAGLAAGFQVLGGGVAANLPIPAGSQPYQLHDKGYGNVAILKINGTGTSVLAGTYLGGSNFDLFDGFAIDSTGNVYVTGTTNSNDFPTTSGVLQSALGSSGFSGFISKLNPTLTALVFSTYFGNTSNIVQGAHGQSSGLLALDSSGDVFVAGEAAGVFPVTPGAFQSACTATDCPYFAELKSDGSMFLSATFLDNNSDTVSGVAVAGSGNIYVAGLTNSPTFPVLNPVQPCTSLGPEAFGDFLSEFSSAGSQVFSTCLGLRQLRATPVLTLDASGNAYVSDATQAGLPLQNPIDSNAPAANGQRPYVSEISASTHALLFSSYVAGAGSFDTIKAIAVDSTGNLYLAGQSGITANGSSQFPVFNALQPTFCGDCTDGFIMKVSPTTGAAAAVVPSNVSFPSVAVGTASSPVSVTISDLGTDALTVSSVAITGDFAIASNNCASVSASGGSCAVQVTFTPTVLGARTGTLTITDSSPGSPRTVALTGQGATVNLTASPASLTFSSQKIGTTSAKQYVTLTAGAADISALSIQTTGDFAETNTCGTSIPAFQTCTLNVTFTPSASGTRTGTITISSSAPNSPQTVSLTGSIGSTLGLAAASSTATVAAGSGTTYSLSIGGQGLSGTASLSCTGAPANATCSVPATVPVSGTTASTFTVTVSTTARAVAVPWAQRIRLTPWPLSLASLIALLLLYRKRTQPRFALTYAIMVFLPVIFLLGACGGGPTTSSNANGTATGSYQLTVTAKVGSTSQSVNLTLNVQ